MKKRVKKNKKNYFSEFLEGELSLPHSYWLVGIVYSLVVGFLVGIITAVFDLPERVMSVLLLPWIIFITIGIWRSADNYKGPKFWSILAKIAVVLSVIQSVASVLVGV